ncbi:helix-turn-helix transcriptional regulator [Conexibacter woesei]|uniref:Transcriptional regulator, LuxR family n=1 Tax=Conexibacter woesei (strain DSM 14684 / CCUG 47730 / CIP 108061 / JCM 11494 / NBRC 100937 / ID131577) TaxID=469383 RepID=D3F373_CONWI|nr:LuxR C-terminal-related transcriptional regulator [Conexibacter woesei]ADB50353.1 transcriptional regulator, LuxR family [Conexibacter woesei DSM 14684]
MSWSEAYASLSHADTARAAPLPADELERLATAAYMVGHAEAHLHALERAHQAHSDAGAPLRAVRCAIWLGIFLALRGEQARATGWLSRARRMLAHQPADCVERGYLLLPVVIRHAAAGEDAAAHAAAADAAATAERSGDADLLALAVHEQGLALARQGHVEQGLGLLDEAMVAVTAGELSPIVTGLLYCSVIDGCHELYALRRAQEWTTALTCWCEQQPDMVAFTGLCLVHRAELMQLHGAWRDALDEARRARGRFTRTGDGGAAARARYREGEVHRLRGELAAAERAFRDAHLGGAEPLPGLALLRLAQGDGPAAAATIRRALGETTAPLQRARLLPASVEIALAIGDKKTARDACAELERIAADHGGGGLLHALVAHAHGAVGLDRGDATVALRALREAREAWRLLEAPYEGARTSLLLALACRALGDEATAALELDAACATFARLGATPDLARAERVAGRPAGIAAGDLHGLSPRELQVLRLVAAGTTNRAIAAELVLSERTVDRHVSNILAKLRLPSRTAATAYAYENELV